MLGPPRWSSSTTVAAWVVGSAVACHHILIICPGPETIKTLPAGAALAHDSQLVDVHGVAWGRAAGSATDGLNDVNLCPRFPVCHHLSETLDVATGNRLGSCLWSFRYAALAGPGVGGLNRGVWQQHHPLAGGWCGATIGPLAVFAGLCARSERQLDRQEERRWRYRCFTGSSATAGTDHGNSPRTRILGSRPATGSGQAVAHRRSIQTSPRAPEEALGAGVAVSGALHRDGRHLGPPTAWASRSPLPAPTQNQQPQEGGRSPAGKYVVPNPRPGELRTTELQG